MSTVVLLAALLGAAMSGWSCPKPFASWSRRRRDRRCLLVLGAVAARGPRCSISVLRWETGMRVRALGPLLTDLRIAGRVKAEWYDWHAEGESPVRVYSLGRETPPC